MGPDLGPVGAIDAFEILKLGGRSNVVTITKVAGEDSEALSRRFNNPIKWIRLNRLCGNMPFPNRTGKGIAMFSVLDLRGIASAGGGLTLNAAGFSSLDLRSLAAAGKNTGAQLVLKNVAAFSSLDLRGIAAASPGNVHFELA